MKKALLLISVLCAIHSVRAMATDGVPLRYGSTMDAGYGNDNAILTPYVSFPTRIMGAFSGCEISRIRIGLMKEAKNVTVYIKNAPRDAKALLSQKAGTLHAGWNDIELSTPLALTGDSIAIGYKATFAAGDGGGAAYSLSALGKQSDVYLNSNSQWTAIDGTFCIEAVVTGDKLPQNQLSLELVPVSDYTYDEQPQLTAIVYNRGANAVTDYSLWCRAAIAEVVSNESPVVLLPGDTDTISVRPLLQLGDNNIGIGIASVNGADDSYAADNDVAVQLPLRDRTFMHRMVMEEGTGDWCQFCVQGIEEVRYMKEHYPEEFIAICIHGNDAMEIKDDAHSYGPLLSRMPGFPDCFLDRIDDCSPYNNVRRYFKSIQKEPGLLGLTGSLAFNADSTMLTLTARAIASASLMSSQPSVLQALRLSAVLLEDSIPGRQYNGFSGGSSGWFYGWESLPRDVEMNYDDVARGVYPSFEGTPFCEGVAWEPDTTYVQELSFEVPASVLGKKNLHVVALLTKDDGTIANACNVFPSSLPSSLSPLTTTHSCSPVIVYDLHGRELHRGASIDAALQGVSGLVIIRTGDGKCIKVSK